MAYSYIVLSNIAFCLMGDRRMWDRLGPQRRAVIQHWLSKVELEGRKNVRLSRVVYEKRTEKYIMADWKHNELGFYFTYFFF